MPISAGKISERCVKSKAIQRCCSGKLRSTIIHMPASSSTWPITKLASSPSSPQRSEEHTSELQSHSDLVCRLLLEKKKKNTRYDDDLTSRHCSTLSTHTAYNLLGQHM